VLLSVFFLASLAGCQKAKTADLYSKADNLGLFRTWTWLESVAGPWRTISPADSVVTLTLNSNGKYATTINGINFSEGSFQITNNSNGGQSLHFNNIPSTMISTALNGNTIIQYGFLQVGQLFLYVDEEIQIDSNGLQLLRTPISPEDYNSIFKK
jgi:hypothetical protein